MYERQTSTPSQSSRNIGILPHLRPINLQSGLNQSPVHPVEKPGHRDSLPSTQPQAKIDLSRLILVPDTVSYRLSSLPTWSIWVLLNTRVDTSSAQVVYLAEMVAPGKIIPHTIRFAFILQKRAPTQAHSVSARVGHHDESGTRESFRPSLISTIALGGLYKRHHTSNKLLSFPSQ